MCLLCSERRLSGENIRSHLLEGVRVAYDPVWVQPKGAKPKKKVESLQNLSGNFIGALCDLGCAFLFSPDDLSIVESTYVIKKGPLRRVYGNDVKGDGIHVLSSPDRRVVGSPEKAIHGEACA